MELRHLRYFVVLAEELNFRRAAERLHITAPTLSVQIKQLEDLLGVRLSERDTSNVRLTPAGEVFLGEARKLLYQAEKARASVKDVGRGGQLRIGNPLEFGYSFMPEALVRYYWRFPEVDIAITELNVEEEQARALESGIIQIGFVPAAQARRMLAVGHLPLIDTSLCAVMSPKHPLAASRRVTLGEMSAHPLLAFSSPEDHLQTMLIQFRERGIEPKNIIRVGGSTALLAMLTAGRGVTLLPKLRILETYPQLVARPLKDAPDFRVQLHAVWKTDKVSRHVLNFVEILREMGLRRK